MAFAELERRISLTNFSMFTLARSMSSGWSDCIPDLYCLVNEIQILESNR
jgi:hypothetical protein